MVLIVGGSIEESMTAPFLALSFNFFNSHRRRKRYAKDKEQNFEKIEGTSYSTISQRLKQIEVTNFEV